MIFWYIGIGIALYLMIGGVIARVDHLDDIRRCEAGPKDRYRKHCTLGKRCDEHKDSASGLFVLLWGAVAIIGIPWLICTKLGDTIDAWIVLWQTREERRETKRVEQREDYEHAVKVLADAGVNVVKIDGDQQ